MAPKRKATLAPTRRSKRLKARDDAGNADSTVKDPPPTLLTLPAEIRNIIAALVLKDDSPTIQITPSFREPAYLSTNRQIRSENRNFYHSMNTFTITESNGKIETLQAFYKNPGRLQTKRIVYFDLDGALLTGADDVLKWCRDHDYETPVFGGALSRPGPGKLDFFFTWLGENIFGAAIHSGWEKCSEALNVLRFGLPKEEQSSPAEPS